MPFRPVPRRDRKLNRVIKAGEVRAVRRAASIYEPGDGVRDAFLVRAGHVRIWQSVGDGVKPRTVEVSGPGEMFGLESVFAGPGIRRRFGARAGEGTTLVVLSGADVAAAFRTGSRTFNYVVRAMFDDLSVAYRLGLGRGAPVTSERVADVLLDLADRFGVPEGAGLRIDLRFTHQTLADLAGAHRSTVTTLVNDWMYRGILKSTGPGLLVRPKRLKKHGSGHGRSGDTSTEGSVQRR